MYMQCERQIRMDTAYKRIVHTWKKASRTFIIFVNAINETSNEYVMVIFGET